MPRRVLRPLQEFLATETASGVLLLAAAVLALAWANSPWRGSYERLWHTALSVRFGGLRISEDVRGWINEGMMALFFLVAGMEIKRELLTGELRSRRAALLPVIAAVGGMVVPAAIYLAFNARGIGANGWGVAMPTDLVFAVGILALVPAIPAGLRAFVLALAIVDDLASIAVISLFYSSRVHWLPVLVCVGLAALVIGLERIQVRASAVYIGLGVALWVAMRASGITPTLAGVVVGFLTPAVPFQRPRAVSEEAHRVADATVDDPFPPDADAHHWLRLTVLSREAVSPLARVEHYLHPWTSFLIVPIFVLANAGVRFSKEALTTVTEHGIAVGLIVARMIGKPVGITLASMLAVWALDTRLPAGVRWIHIVGAGAAAGIPFTVSFFIAELALPPGSAVAMAKLGILIAAVLSGGLAVLVLTLARRRT